jgi:hypothetical protein
MGLENIHQGKNLIESFRLDTYVLNKITRDLERYFGFPFKIYNVDGGQFVVGNSPDFGYTVVYEKMSRTSNRIRVLIENSGLSEAAFSERFNAKPRSGRFYSYLYNISNRIKEQFSTQTLSEAIQAPEIEKEKQIRVNTPMENAVNLARRISKFTKGEHRGNMIFVVQRHSGFAFTIIVDPAVGDGNFLIRTDTTHFLTDEKPIELEVMYNIEDNLDDVLYEIGEHVKMLRNAYLADRTKPGDEKIKKSNTSFTIDSVLNRIMQNNELKEGDVDNIELYDKNETTREIARQLNERLKGRQNGSKIFIQKDVSAFIVYVSAIDGEEYEISTETYIYEPEIDGFEYGVNADNLDLPEEYKERFAVENREELLQFDNIAKEIKNHIEKVQRIAIADGLQDRRIERKKDINKNNSSNNANQLGYGMSNYGTDGSAMSGMMDGIMGGFVAGSMGLL